MAQRNLKIKELCMIALMSAVIALCSFLAVPVGSVPHTLQLLGVFSALYLLGGRGGTVSVLLYLFIGLVGLPVFSGFRGGAGALFDAGGGFLLGFSLGSGLFWLLEALFGKSVPIRLISSVLSLLLIYLSGSLWYSVVYLGSLSFFFEALLVTVLPFILLDTAKIAIAWFISSRISKYVKF